MISNQFESFWIIDPCPTFVTQLRLNHWSLCTGWFLFAEDSRFIRDLIVACTRRVNFLQWSQSYCWDSLFPVQSWWWKNCVPIQKEGWPEVISCRRLQLRNIQWTAIWWKRGWREIPCSELRHQWTLLVECNSMQRHKLNPFLLAKTPNFDCSDLTPGSDIAAMIFMWNLRHASCDPKGGRKTWSASRVTPWRQQVAAVAWFSFSGFSLWVCLEDSFACVSRHPDMEAVQA